MAVTHATVKAPGQTLAAVADWNANHAGTIDDAMHGIRTLANAHSHADLSNVTSDQHHARQHALTAAADHTGQLSIAMGGSGQATQQAAIDALTNVAGGANEDVLTKDTATGNAIFKAPAAVGGDFIKIAETVVAGAAVTQVQFASLDLDTDQTYYLFFFWINGIGSSITPNIEVNADTTATNYYNQYIDGDGGSVSAARNNTPSSLGLNANDVLAGWTCMQKVAGKACSYVGNFIRNAISITPKVDLFIVEHTPTTNVTSIEFRSSVANGIAVGSRFIIFKAP